jgi:hypothetical protein
LAASATVPSWAIRKSRSLSSGAVHMWTYDSRVNAVLEPGAFEALPAFGVI